MFDMSNAVDAMVNWKDEAEGGRSLLPPGPQYMALADFDNATKPVSEEGWDLVVQFVEPPRRNTPARARVRFSAEDAPKELLRPGNRFRLLEGFNCVAEGVVLD
jgi:hypothetical protein